MNWDEEKEAIFYRVITDGDRQYSIWPEDRAIPKGWHTTGEVGSKEECFDYIKEIWLQMSPLNHGKSFVEESNSNGRDFLKRERL
ncbi:MbtH domain protein [Nitrosococcus halophilus Nc 4]|uniref:MbtH domain protein n=1 Tax=Nitrosococcus halophilus (strain Nc4) TaxID=472759 RepID=D5C367_NITHN|nr:MbtH family NRPS accessory protein [Nitrosococcus halophilus]ADE14959.1 MbtH domain protein [Nitrosococcus halophilus Nc 4]ADE14975.1 MbtH domain protein [Nitrosococcus halophilus Nc 4]